MRTLQEKYNGINEGTFSKEQFLRDARLQLPNLITQYNGYDDAVQILKNRGMIQEISSDTFKSAVDVARGRGENQRASKMGSTFLNSFVGKPLRGGRISKIDIQKPSFGDYFDVTLEILVPTKGNAKGEPAMYDKPLYMYYDVENDNWNLKDKGIEITRQDARVLSQIAAKVNPETKYRNGTEYFDIKGFNEATVSTGPTRKGGFLISNLAKGDTIKHTKTGTRYGVRGVGVDEAEIFNLTSGKFETITSLNGFEPVNVKSLNEARLTNKSLTDYRYKPTNDLDKYPYEQILRGLRVELEGMQVTGTPTADEYKKALAKVLKNLQKDEIFYTNQIAGTNKKVDDHDQMVPIQGKEKEIKNSVDTFNGLKKAQLKEGFKSLIKKVLSENADPLHDYYESKESKKPISEAPASNNPKIEKLVDGINQLISQAVEDGEPVGVIWPGGTWDEPYIYQPIVYKNGQLKVTSRSVYGGQPQTELVRSRDMEMDGIPMLRTLMRMYKKAVKKLGSNVNEGTESAEKTVNLKQLHKIAMKAGNFGSDVKDALLNLYMGYEDKVPVTVIAKVLGQYDLTFADLKDQPATFRPSSEFAHLFNSSKEELEETGEDVTGASNATGEYEIMMHMLDANVSNRSDAAKFFSLNYSDMPEQQIEFLTNHYFDNFHEEDQVDEEYSRVLDLPDGEYFAIDGDWEDEYKGHNGLFFTVDSGSIYDKDGEAFQVSPREFISQFKPDEILKVEEEELSEIGMFHDPTGYKKSEPEPQVYTKKFVKATDKKGVYVYDIFKNGKLVKTIEGGEGDANAWMNQASRDDKKELNESVSLKDLLD